MLQQLSQREERPVDRVRVGHDAAPVVPGKTAPHGLLKQLVVPLHAWYRTMGSFF